MRTGSSLFLVDTNVLVYAYDVTDPIKQGRAINVLTTLSTNQTGSLSAQILGEFFVTVIRRIAPPLSLAEAEMSIVRYRRSWTIFDITDTTVAEGIRIVQRESISYWDALVVATARLNRVPYILSEDMSDGALVEGVRVLNPFALKFNLSLLGQK